MIHMLPELRSRVDQGGEDVPDIGAVLGDHGDRIAAVALAQRGTAEKPSSRAWLIAAR